MFEGFAGVWTPVAVAARLGREPRSVRLAGEDIALFRDARGRVGALVDRCPHRGVKLSLGRVGEDGCLACPFHGWRFDRDGACVKVPLNDVPADKLRRHDALALPARQVGGLVWVFTDPHAESPGEPYVPEALVDPSMSRAVHEETWSTHWTRAMENMLDFPHLPFIHRRTIGRDLTRVMRDDSVMRLETTALPHGLRIHSRLDGAEDPAFLDWVRPNGMVLTLPVPGRRLQMHMYCVPIDAGRTRMMLLMTRDFGRWNPLLRLFALFNRRILMEDRAVVESSQPAEVPDAAEEISVASDAPTLAFRRYYLRTLKPSRADGRRSGTVVPASALSSRAGGAGRASSAA